MLIPGVSVSNSTEVTNTTSFTRETDSQREVSRKKYREMDHHLPRLADIFFVSDEQVAIMRE